MFVVDRVLRPRAVGLSLIPQVDGQADEPREEAAATAQVSFFGSNPSSSRFEKPKKQQKKKFTKKKTVLNFEIAKV